MKRRSIFPLLSFVWALLAPHASVATEALSLVPEKALGFVVVNRLGETNGKVEKLAGRLQLPLPSPLDFFQQLSGIQQGLDKKGDLMLAFLPGKEGLSDAFPVAFIPVTDYKEFVTQFGAQDPKAKFVKVPVGGEPVLIGNQGTYAVLAEPEHEDALMKLLDAEAIASPALAPIKDWLTSNDASAILTPAGMKLLLKTGLESLEKSQAEFDAIDDADDDSGEIFAQVRRTFEMYAQVLRFLQRELTVCGLGLRIEGPGDVHLTGRALVSPQGELTKYAAQVKPPATNPIASLPAEPYVLAFGGNFSGALTDALTDWSAKMVQANPGMYGLEKITDEQAKKLAQISVGTMEGVRWMSLIMGPGEGDEPFYSSFVAALGVDDAKKYLADYEEALKGWNEILKTAKNDPTMPWEIERVEIAGGNGLKFTMDMSRVFAAQGMPGFDNFMDMFVGPGGKLTTYAAPADDKTVMMAYISRENLEKAIAAYKSGGMNLSQQPQLAATTSKLPAGANWVCYFSPSGAITLANRMLASFAENLEFKLPEFGDSPPVGWAAKVSATGLETDLVFPEPTVKAIYEYVEKVQNTIRAQQ